MTVIHQGGRDACRADHVQSGARLKYPGFCANCGQDWPCDMIKLLDALEQAEAKIGQHDEWRREFGEQSKRRCQELVRERDDARVALSVLEPVALSAIAFRKADKERMLALQGCVMPPPDGEYLRCRTEFRRTTDAVLSAAERIEGSKQ